MPEAQTLVRCGENRASCQRWLIGLGITFLLVLAGWGMTLVSMVLANRERIATLTTLTSAVEDLRQGQDAMTAKLDAEIRDVRERLVRIEAAVK